MVEIEGSKNTPEMDKFASNDNVIFEFGVGGDFKMNSSSWILNSWKGVKSLGLGVGTGLLMTVMIIK